MGALEKAGRQVSHSLSKKILGWIGECPSGLGTTLAHPCPLYQSDDADFDKAGISKRQEQ